MSFRRRCAYYTHAYVIWGNPVWFFFPCRALSTPQFSDYRSSTRTFCVCVCLFPRIRCKSFDDTHWERVRPRELETTKRFCLAESRAFKPRYASVLYEYNMSVQTRSRLIITRRVTGRPVRLEPETGSVGIHTRRSARSRRCRDPAKLYERELLPKRTVSSRVYYRWLVKAFSNTTLLIYRRRGSSYRRAEDEPDGPWSRW